MKRVAGFSWLLVCAALPLACSDITGPTDQELLAAYPGGRIFDSMETRATQVGDPAPGFLRGDGTLVGHGIEVPFGEARSDGSRDVHKWGWWVSSYKEVATTSATESVGEFRDGHREGQWIFWHRNGRMRARGTFTRSQMTGRWECWREDGSIDAEHSGEYSEGRRIGG